MIHIFTAIIPIFSLIMIGYFLKKIQFPSVEFWPQADKLTYYVLMPSLLIYKLATASFEGINSINFVLTALFTISLVLIILILINKIFNFKGDSFTSIVQGSIRFNTYVFLALADSVFGDKGLVLAAILMMFVIPFINIICISIFALYVNDSKLTFLYLIKSIITNPLIVACFLGGFINFMGIELFSSFDKILEILSSAALPLGLLSVGFGLVIKEITSSKEEIVITNIAKLVLTPLIMFVIADFFKLNDFMISILIIFAVLPTAPSSFVLARQLGGNIKLMSSIITVQTLLSAFFIMLVLNYFI
ncbi:putative permease [Malaciobacter marinus]|uniref:Putative permease n=1 Tax=Malaciobacter marinus TaxID=505249 RepID=A0A347TI32_9BACT|nr:AEC family transporter [Malaciobacter marinus]AXX86260.1 putative permease [Malaciobacter marinus]PHO14654.1 transporter [Malaciobacter marinus]